MRAFKRTLEHLSTPSNCRDLNTPYFGIFSRPSPYGFGYSHRHTPYTSRDLETFPTSRRKPLYDFRGLQNFHSKNIYGYGLWFISTKTRSFYVSRPETGLNLATRWSEGLKICQNMLKISFGVIETF